MKNKELEIRKDFEEKAREIINNAILEVSNTGRICGWKHFEDESDDIRSFYSKCDENLDRAYKDLTDDETERFYEIQSEFVVYDSECTWYVAKNYPTDSEYYEKITDLVEELEIKLGDSYEITSISNKLNYIVTNTETGKKYFLEGSTYGYGDTLTKEELENLTVQDLLKELNI